MSQIQLATIFLQPAAISANEEATNHPASNVGVFTKWARTARSTTTNPWTITFDFGVTVAGAGFFLNNANFAAVKAAVSPNNSTWTELYGAFGFALGADDRLGGARRKQWFDASTFGATWNHRYLRIQPLTLDAGATFWELGAVAFPNPVVLMTRNWGPPEFTVREPMTRLPYAGGGSEGNIEGREFVAFDLTFGPNFKDALPQQHTLRSIGQDLPFFMHENRGDPTHAYILKRVAEVKFAEQFAALSAGPWTLEETV